MLSYAFSLGPPRFATAFFLHSFTLRPIHEAPVDQDRRGTALASYALLPMLRAYFKRTGVEIETADISLARRIIANFPECLRNDQKIPDELTRLGKLAQTPEANIIKLPNISASIPRLRDAIAELRGKAYNTPDYLDEPSTEERALQARFAVVLGSAVNPVLREGNSDRRASRSVKAFARKPPLEEQFTSSPLGGRAD